MNITLSTFQEIRDIKNDVYYENEQIVLKKYGVEEEDKLESEHCDSINDEVYEMSREDLKAKIEDYESEERYSSAEIEDIKEMWALS